MTEPRIVLATPHAGYEQRVRRAFGEDLDGQLRRCNLLEDGDGGRPNRLLDGLGDSAPDVVAIGPDIAVDAALDLARTLDLERPEISVLLVAEPTAELWEQALRSGVRDVLSPDAVDADLRAGFERALAVAERRRHNLVGDPSDSAPHGRIITVLSPKGGSGKTTVATNLALGLAMVEPNRAALVDLDLQFGDVAAALRLTPDHSIVDAVRGAQVGDHLLLKTYLASHTSGLWSLCGSDSPADGEVITAAQAQGVVRSLADEFAYVVVDTSAGLPEHTLSVIEVSTDLVVIAAMDVPSVRSLRKELDALDQLGMVHARRHLVINRADSKVGLDLRDVEATVGQSVDIALPSSRLVPLSVNQGSPLVESEPRSPVARQLTALVDRFVERPAELNGSKRRVRRAR